ncbi:MAG TPA: hypothetical protein VFS60_00760, partial [Thermoanaerobaculia bacterium]|nr:hypothetical protein [Thermoanaerobaculia bacterium]
MASTIAERELGPLARLDPAGELAPAGDPEPARTRAAALGVRRSEGGASALPSRRPGRLRGAMGLRGSLRWRRAQRLVLWTAMLLVAVVFLRTVVLYRHVPPGRFNYDDTSYHLT